MIVGFGGAAVAKLAILAANAARKASQRLPPTQEQQFWQVQFDFVP